MDNNAYVSLYKHTRKTVTYGKQAGRFETEKKPRDKIQKVMIWLNNDKDAENN